MGVESLDLSRAGTAPDDVWGELNLHLTRSKGLCLVFLYAGDSRTLSDLRARLDDVWAWRTAPLRLIEPVVTEGLPGDILRGLEDEVQRRPDLRAPVWIQLTTLDVGGEERWELIRHQTLYRLNEWRSWLEQSFRRPLVIALPAAWQAQVAAVAPDLWHIRTMSARIASIRGGPYRIPDGRSLFASVFHLAPPQPDADLDDIDGVSAAIERARTEAAQGSEAALLDLSVQLSRAGAWFYQQDRGQEAEVALAEAEGILEAMRKSAPGLFASELRTLAELRGDVQMELGQPGSALAHFLRASTLWDSPGVTQTMRAEGVLGLLIKISDSQVELHRTDEASATLAAAQKLWDELSDGTRDWLRSQGVQAKLLMRQGRRLSELGRADDAVDRYRQAVVLQREGLLDASDSAEAIWMLAQSLMDLGVAQDYINQTDAAQQSLSECVALLRALFEERPESLTYLNDLANGLMVQGDIVGRQHRWAEASALYQEAVTLAQRYEDEVGSSVRSIQLLFATLSRRGEAETQLGQLHAALTTFGECQSLLEQLSQRVGDTDDVLRMRTIALEGLAVGYLALGDPISAVNELQASLGIARQLAERGRRRPSTLWDLAITLEHLARAYAKADCAPDAAAAWAEALSLYQELRKVEGDSPGILVEMADCLEGLAVSCIQGADGQKSGDQMLASALTHIDTALALRRRLAEAFPQQSQHRDALAHGLALQESLRSNGRASP